MEGVLAQEVHRGKVQRPRTHAALRALEDLGARLQFLDLFPHLLRLFSVLSDQPLVLIRKADIDQYLHTSTQFSTASLDRVLGPVVRRVDNFIHWINSYPADKTGAFLILIGRANSIHWIGIYLLDKVIHSLYNWALVNMKCYGQLSQQTTTPGLPYSYRVVRGFF